MEISILHLSDLHITNRNGIYSDVHKNLLQDIKKQCQYLNHIIIVITGDVIDKANYDETFEVAKKFFQDLYEYIGDKVIGVEIVPGNHDKKQHSFDKHFVEVQRELCEIPEIDTSDWEYHCVSYKKYFALANTIRNIFNKNSMKIVDSSYVEAIDEQQFAIIFINLDTSWASYGGNEDKRKLRINLTQLSKLRDAYQSKRHSLSKPCITIMTAHHPLSWLKESDETFLSSWLFNSEYFNIDFYLSGHTHDRQIKSYFDTYKSYITLVTGIGWENKRADESNEFHRYSIYHLNLRTNSCEISIRKTCTDGNFDYDNDVLLTDLEKKDKRIYLPIKPFNCRPTLKIPVYRDNFLKSEYLFIDNTVIEKMKTISILFYDIMSHMKQFQAMHIQDFFVKYELYKRTEGTKKKEEIYKNYFYRNEDNSTVTNLFNEIANKKIIYENFLSYLRELCGIIVTSFKDAFPGIDYIRLHIRKNYRIKVDANMGKEENELYITLCQANAEHILPSIRDINYDSMIKLAFDNNCSFVYSHNKEYNPLSKLNEKYDNFITMAPNSAINTYRYKREGKEYLRPYLAAALSIKCNIDSNLLDILNYLNIQTFIFGLIYDYVDLFKIKMEDFIKEDIS